MRTLTAVVVGLVLLAAGAVMQERRPQDVALQAAIRTETVDGDLESAIKQYADIAAKYQSDRAVVATALVHMAGCYQKRGDAQATKIYEQVLLDFGDQKEAVAIARAKRGGNGNAVRATAMTYRRVWAGPTVDAGGTVSPDGRHLSYVDWDTGDLVLRDLIAGTDRRLTDKGGWAQSNAYAESSVISRDGTDVAYAWFNGKDRYELRIANLKTSSIPRARTVLDRHDVIWIAPYDWSPDGRSIAVALNRPDRSTEIGVVDVQDGSLRKLRSTDWRGVTKALFSPDGRHLAFDLSVGEGGDDERDAFVLAVDGGRETPVAPNPGREIVMGWSPDGTRLLFASDRGGTTALWAHPFKNGTPQGAPELMKSDIGHAPLGISAAGSLYVGHLKSEVWVLENFLPAPTSAKR